MEHSGLTPEEIAAGYERMKFDREAGLTEQVGWLTEAGFTDVSCLHKYYFSPCSLPGRRHKAVMRVPKSPRNA